MITQLTKLLNIKYPIIQAPIGSATTPQLASAVSNAGGLGTLALSWKNLELTRSLIRQTKTLTTKPFAVNLILDFEQEEYRLRQWRIEIVLMLPKLEMLITAKVEKQEYDYIFLQI